MNDTMETVVDTTTTQEAPISAPEATISTTPSTNDVEVIADTAPITNEWAPDFSKLKVMDKEFDWDEDIKKVVNKDNYERLKELHNKAYGLPFIKDRLNQTKDEVKKLKEIEQVYTKQTQNINYLSSLLNKGDFMSFFKALEIPDQVVMRYALDRANYYELPNEKRMEYDQNIESKQMLTLYEQQNAQLQTQLQAQAAMAREQELSSYLTKPEVQQIASEFDTKLSRPGAFREEIIKRGQHTFYHTGADITPEQAGNEVLGLFKTFINPSGVATQAAPSVTVPKEKPVIPNIKSGAHSPARKLPRSIADLKQMASQMED